jgi:hypothetical protein
MDNYAAYELLSSTLRAGLNLTGTVDLRAEVRNADRVDNLLELRRVIRHIETKNPRYADCELFQLAKRLATRTESIPPMYDMFYQRSE